MERILAALAISVLITGCGGGSSPSPTSTAPVTTTPPPPVTSSKLTFSDHALARGIQHSHQFSSSYEEFPRSFGGGGAAGDIDGDGDIDVFITRGDMGPNLLFINEGGEFVERAVSAGLASASGTTNFLRQSGPTFADIDGDGDLDLFIGGLEYDPAFVFKNDGTGNFEDVTAGSGLDNMTSRNTLSAAFGDYDLDGDLDLAMAHWGTPRTIGTSEETETLWRNDSTATQIIFTPVSVESGIADAIELDLSGPERYVGGHDYTFAPNFSDFNNDGYPDLLSVSDFNGSKVFLNNQDGTFSDQTDRTQITDMNGMGTAVGDFDNDGDLDWFVSSVDGNRLYTNMNNTFISGTPAADDVEYGGWGWASCFVDFDLDGHLDIYQTNGWYSNSSLDGSEPYSADTSRLWMADGEGRFKNEATESGIADAEQGRGAICADFDNDYDTDILLLLNGTDEAARLWVNDMEDGNALKIRLQGVAPNPYGIGAKILLRTESHTQFRELTVGSNYISHNPPEEIFGLGDSTIADEIHVTWPDGRESWTTNVSANQTLVIAHPDL